MRYIVFGSTIHGLQCRCTRLIIQVPGNRAFVAMLAPEGGRYRSYLVHESGSANHRSRSLGFFQDFKITISVPSLPNSTVPDSQAGVPGPMSRCPGPRLQSTIVHPLFTDDLTPRSVHSRNGEGENFRRVEGNLRWTNALVIRATRLFSTATRTF